MNATTRYRCPGCRQLHTQRSQAEQCCKPIAREVFVCIGCDGEFMSVVDAGQCCLDKLDHTPNTNYGSVYR